MRALRHVLVVGGGIGGLSAAIAFLQRGVAVDLIEKRPDFEVPGVGLGQPASALRIYDQFGVLEEILATGFHYGHMSIHAPDHSLIAAHRFRMGDDRVPAFCALPRSRLHRILLDRATALGVTIRLGTEIASHGGPLGTEITFADGSTATYDLVAGFDGIRSGVRHHLVGDMFGPRHSGFGAWRLQVERPEGVTGMEFLQGIDGKAGAIPIGQDRMYLFNIRPETPGVMFAQDQMHVLLAERLSQFGGYVAEIARDLTPQSPIVYGALEPFILPHPWHRGAVVVGGDAAHVVPPHLTAGAAMAVEDAFVLARCLCEGEGTLDVRLQSYGEQRFARNAFVYAFARDWLEAEQAVRSQADLDAACAEMARNASARIAVADSFLERSI